MSTTKKDIAIKVGIAVLFFTFLFILFRSTTMTDDDTIYYHMSFDGFSQVLDYVWNFGNGRYLGNILGILMSRHHVFSAVLQAGTLTAMVMLLPYMRDELCSVKEYILYVFMAGSMLICCAPGIFSQVYTWKSGFANYVFPLLFQLVSILLVLRWHEKDYTVFIIAGIGFIGQFFAEHIALTSCLIGFLLTYCCKGNKKKRLCAVTYTSAAVIGFLCMYLLPMAIEDPMGAALVGGDLSNYRGIRLNVSGFIPFGFSFFRNFFLAFWLAIYIAHKGTVVAKLLVGMAVLFSLFAQYANSTVDGYVYGATAILILICEILSALLLVTGLIASRRFRGKFNKDIVWPIAALFSYAPFVLVYPVDDRCVHAAMFFVSIFLVRKIDVIELKSMVKYILFGGVFFISGLYMNQLSVNKQIYEIRENYILSQMEVSDEILVYGLPYAVGKYDGNSLKWMYYHEEPGDVSFKISFYRDYHSNVN